MLALRDWLAIIGISSLIATVVSHWLSQSREHQRWCFENRRVEWRELIDHLYKVTHQDSVSLEELHEGTRLLGTRIFIRMTLHRHKFPARWMGLIRETVTSDGTIQMLFTSRSAEFLSELTCVAEADFDIGPKTMEKVLLTLRSIPSW